MRELDRMVNVTLLENILREGDQSPNKESGKVDIELEVGPTVFKVVVSEDPDSSGNHDIVTVFPNVET